MSKDILKEHYNHKYSSDKYKLIEPIQRVRVPRTRFEAIASLFPKHFNGGEVLEIGAGNGRVAKNLLEQNVGISSYTASDLSFSRLEGLSNNLQDDRLSLIELDAEAISEGDLGQYDAIIMIALIEHLVDPLGTMRVIRQLLKPGGFVYIDTPNIAKYTRRIKLLLGRFPSTASKNEGLTTYSGEDVELYDEGHLHYFTYRSLSCMLKEICGYSKIVKLGYPEQRIRLGDNIDNFLVFRWPEVFSELVVIAYK